MLRRLPEQRRHRWADLSYNLPLQQGFEHHQIGTLAQTRASLSYIPGSHNMKFGYQGNVSHPSQAYFNTTPFIQYRFNNGIPNQLTQTACIPGHGQAAAQHPHDSFYAQDTYTRERLTLQGGIRYDGIGTGYPDTGAGGPDYQLMPTPLVLGCRNHGRNPLEGHHAAHGRSVRPFRQRPTAIKFNIGKYLDGAHRQQQRPRSAPAHSHHPAARRGRGTTRTSSLPATRETVTSSRTATWSVPTRTASAGAMDNQNFGKEVFTKDFDPELINGWGKRTYNWEMGVSVQQELVPRVGLTVGYFRRWFGNFYTADNRLTTAADYTPFSIPVPADPRLPGGGGGTVTGLYNLVPGKVGQEVMYSQLSSRTSATHDGTLAGRRRQRQRAAAERADLAGRHEHGRLAARTTVRALRLCPRPTAGISTAAVQTTRVATTAGSTSTSGLQNSSCRVDEPFLTSFRGPGDLHRAEDRCAGERHLAQRSRDPSSRADYVVTSAIAQPSLGRPCHRATSPSTCSSRARCMARDQQHRHSDREDLPVRTGRARSSAWTSTTC